MIGTTEEKAYRDITSHSTKNLRSLTVFRFESSLKPRKGLNTLRMPLHDRKVLYLKVDVVEWDNILVLRLDTVRNDVLILDFYVN